MKNFNDWLDKQDKRNLDFPEMAALTAWRAQQACIDKLAAELQQYKSIVKTVDPDNLPNGEVIAIDSTKEFIISDGLWLDTFGTAWAGSEFENIDNITHYIETKDLIKLFK